MIRVLVSALVVVALASSTGGATTPDLTTRAGFERALKARFGPATRLSWDPLRATPRALRRLSEPSLGADDGARALGFVGANRALLGLGSEVALVVHEVTRRSTGAVVHLSARLAGLPVEGAFVAVTLDDSGRVRAVRRDPLPTHVERPASPITATAAERAVSEHFKVTSAHARELVVLPTVGRAGVVAWRVSAMVIPFGAYFSVWVDARGGAIVGQAPAAKDQVMRRLEVR